MGIRTQYEAAKAFQEYENFILVASKIFGKEQSKPKPAETYADLEAFVNGIG